MTLRACGNTLLRRISEHQICSVHIADRSLPTRPAPAQAADTSLSSKLRCLTSPRIRLHWKKQLKRLFRAAFVMVIVGAISWLAITRLSNRRSQPDQNPAMISQPIASGRITVNARDFVAYPFSVPAACKQAMVEGDFETAANMIELLIMDETTFPNWKNRLPATPLYSSGRLNRASVNLKLPSSAKRYYFVMNNRTSTRSQIVQARLNLACRIR